MKLFEEEEPVLRLRRLMKEAISSEKFEVQIVSLQISSLISMLFFIMEVELEYKYSSPEWNVLFAFSDLNTLLQYCIIVVLVLCNALVGFISCSKNNAIKDIK